MKDLERKKEIILEHEQAFANAVGSAVFEKPRVSFWMIMIPLLFLYFVYRMQKFKTGRIQFNAEFMVTRRRALDVVVEAVEAGRRPDIAEAVRQSGLPDLLEMPYAEWMRALVDFYMDLLSASGDNYHALVRSAFRGKTEFLLTLNRINTAEKEFYAALKPRMAATEGAADIIGIIQTESRQLRRDLAEQIFS